MKILIDKNEVSVAQSIPDIYNELPLGVYKLMFHELKGFYLTIERPFVLPDKLYGDFSIVDRWLTYRNQHKGNMGILLSGLKGCGKTITAEKFCIDYNRPVILIESAYSGPQFNSFISQFNDVVLFIDEFEKIYESRSEEGSNGLLSLLSGTGDTKLTFILTSNSENINSYMLNRPGRIRYHEKYTELSDDIVKDVVKDLLLYKEYTTELYEVCTQIQELTYDILTSLIKEINLFNESPKKLVKQMNILIEPVKYVLTMKYKDILEFETSTTFERDNMYFSGYIKSTQGKTVYKGMEYSSRYNLIEANNELLAKGEKELNSIISDYHEIENYDFYDELVYEHEDWTYQLKKTEITNRFLLL